MLRHLLMALATSKFLVSRQRRNKQERIFCCDEGSMSENISLVSYINIQNIYIICLRHLLIALATSKFLVSRQRRNKQERIFCYDEGSMSEYISLVSYINTQNIYYMLRHLLMALATSKFLVSRQRRNKQERIFCCDEGSMSE